MLFIFYLDMCDIFPIQFLEKLVTAGSLDLTTAAYR